MLVQCPPPRASLRSAILAAADHIERNPALYHCGETDIPQTITSRASAIGWIAYFYGYTSPDHCATGMTLQLHESAEAFCRYMDRVNTGWRSWFWSWERNAKRCAWCLRRYADRYHPAAVEVSP